MGYLSVYHQVSEFLFSEYPNPEQRAAQRKDAIERYILNDPQLDLGGPARYKNTLIVQSFLQELTGGELPHMLPGCYLALYKTMADVLIVLHSKGDAEITALLENAGLINAIRSRFVIFHVEEGSITHVLKVLSERITRELELRQKHKVKETKSCVVLTATAINDGGAAAEGGAAGAGADGASVEIARLNARINALERQLAEERAARLALQQHLARLEAVAVVGPAQPAYPVSPVHLASAGGGGGGGGGSAGGAAGASGGKVSFLDRLLKKEHIDDMERYTDREILDAMATRYAFESYFKTTRNENPFFSPSGFLLNLQQRMNKSLSEGIVSEGNIGAVFAAFKSQKLGVDRTVLVTLSTIFENLEAGQLRLDKEHIEKIISYINLEAESGHTVDRTSSAIKVLLLLFKNGENTNYINNRRGAPYYSREKLTAWLIKQWLSKDSFLSYETLPQLQAHDLKNADLRAVMKTIEQRLQELQAPLLITVTPASAEKQRREKERRTRILNNFAAEVRKAEEAAAGSRASAEGSGGSGVAAAPSAVPEGASGAPRVRKRRVIDDDGDDADMDNGAAGHLEDRARKRSRPAGSGADGSGSGAIPAPADHSEMGGGGSGGSRPSAAGTFAERRVKRERTDVDCESLATTDDDVVDDSCVPDRPSKKPRGM